MSYGKQTYVSGFNIEGGIDACPHPMYSAERNAWIESHLIHICLKNGHWRTETAMRRARKAGIVGAVNITYDNIDNSGKGRSYVTEQVVAC
jgi:hypothetical protein